MKIEGLGKSDFDESEVLKMQIFVVICSAWKKAVFRRKFDGKCSAELESMSWMDGLNRWLQSMILKMVLADGFKDGFSRWF